MGRDLVFTVLGIDKGSQAFDKTGNAAERCGDKLDKLGTIGIKAMAGLEAASIAAGAGVAAAIGGVPLLFAGMAAAAVSGNKQVQDSFANLRDNVVDDVQKMTEPLADDFVGVAADLNQAWGKDVAPVLNSIFNSPALMNGVRELSKGVGELAGNAMPGFLASVHASEPVMKGFRSLLGDVGTGTSHFLQNISHESADAGRVITGVGGVIEDALGDVGELLGDLTDAVAPHMDRIESVFDRTTDSVLGLADGALPVLSSAAGASLGVLDNVLGVLEPISGTLGTGLGVTLAAAGGWRVLTGAGNAFNKLDLGGKLENTALKAGVMTESLTGSATAGERVATAGSKMASVLRGVGQAIPIVGAAAVALSLAIDASNQSMEQAAERGRSLGEALIKGGSEADRARKRIADLNGENKQLQASYDELSKKQHELGQSGAVLSRPLGELEVKLRDNNVELSKARQNYEDIRNKLTGAELAQVQYNEAVERYGTKSPEAAAAGAALRAALDSEAQKSRDAAAAIKTHIDRIIERQNIMLGAAGADLAYRQAILGVDQAFKNMNDTLAKHTATSLEGRAAIQAYEEQLQGAVAAAGEKAKAEAAGRSESEIAIAVTRAQAAEILNLAAAAGDKAPASLMNMVRALDATTLAAIGVTGRVTETGDAVFRLPDGKEIRITGNNADAKSKIDEINRMEIRDKLFYITTVHREQRMSREAPTGYGPGIAEGGDVEAGHVYTVGERGRETFVPDVDGTVLNHSQTLALERGLTSQASGAGSSGAMSGGGGSVVHKHYHLTVNSNLTAQNLVTEFRRMELLAN